MMNQIVQSKLLDQLKLHEGFRQLPYYDTEGILTVGYGFNLDKIGLSEEESSVILQMRVEALYDQLKDRFGEAFTGLSCIRKAVIINMAYNLGVSGVAGFKRMWGAIQEQDYKEASLEMLDSKWANQVGKRAFDLAKQMRWDSWT